MPHRFSGRARSWNRRLSVGCEHSPSGSRCADARSGAALAGWRPPGTAPGRRAAVPRRTGRSIPGPAVGAPCAAAPQTNASRVRLRSITLFRARLFGANLPSAADARTAMHGASQPSEGSDAAAHGARTTRMRAESRLFFAAWSTLRRRSPSPITPTSAARSSRPIAGTPPIDGLAIRAAGRGGMPRGAVPSRRAAVIRPRWRTSLACAARGGRRGGGRRRGPRGWGGRRPGARRSAAR
jgi:hypothetical protein